MGRATTTARGVGRSAKEARDIERAKKRLEMLKTQLAEMHADFDAEVDRLEARLDPELETLETVVLKPRKKDIDIRILSLAWVPHRRSDDGSITPLWL